MPIIQYLEGRDRSIAVSRMAAWAAYQSPVSKGVKGRERKEKEKRQHTEERVAYRTQMEEEKPLRNESGHKGAAI